MQAYEKKAIDEPVNVEETLDGLMFPAVRIQIITYAEDQGASEEVLEMLRALPLESFNNIQEINRELGKIEKQPGSENLWSSNPDKGEKP